MKAWITKYALTEGIFVVDGDLHSDRMLCYRRGSDWEQYAHGEGKDWHRTEISAITRAEQMRQAKIASLRRSIQKLEGLTFDSNGEPT